MNDYDDLKQRLETLANRMENLTPGEREYKHTKFALETIWQVMQRHPEHEKREAERRQARQLADYLKGER